MLYYNVVLHPSLNCLESVSYRWALFQSYRKQISCQFDRSLKSNWIFIILRIESSVLSQKENGCQLKDKTVPELVSLTSSAHLFTL